MKLNCADHIERNLMAESRNKIQLQKAQSFEQRINIRVPTDLFHRLDINATCDHHCCGRLADLHDFEG